MKSHYKFLGTFLGLLVFNSFTLASFSAWIDPYNVINSRTLPKFNQLKPQSNDDARRFKAINVTRIKPKTIVLGTSRADIGIDPEHPVLSAHAPAYNLSIPAGDMYEAMRYFQHALVNQPDLKQVVLGIDLVAFEHREDVGKLDPEQAARLETTSYVQHLPSLVFSTDTLTSSFSTLTANLKGEPVREYYLSNGRLIRFNPPEMPIEAVFGLHLKSAYFESWYKDFQLSQQQMDAFRTIVETCEQQGIDLKVFISPAHVTQWEALRTSGLWSTFEDWKREVVNITPVWDFSGYNSITTEPLTEEMHNYLESSHYVKEVGDLVLNRVFRHELRTVPNDFGTRITTANVDAHLAKIRADRSKWVRRNADVVQLVEQWSRE
ncbi:MAG: hypothetical protein HC827_05905 [Cyanobacteria bacterium RM1_2_2]|nr:hypothetical protein [Cyanobacteria bacterium RM1_2_2]